MVIHYYFILAWLSTLQIVSSSVVCWMLYQMADNDLEYYLREDNFELTMSDVIRTPDLHTWIYFDNRNFQGTKDDILEPLVNVYNSDGSDIVGRKTTGSQYLRWDHDLEKMVVDRTLNGEQNGDDPYTVMEFVQTALEDCVTQKSATEFFIVFASHGGGYVGFGGDENPNRRNLQQLNQDIVAALTMALGTVPGAPDKFDVIGFDACLMSAVGAADEYRDISNYLLASEAIIPYEGWAYNALTNGNTALDLAVDIQKTFLTEKQGSSHHQTPKTLAVVDLNKFTTFLSSLDHLSGEMEKLLLQKDPDLLIQLNRARAKTIAFEGPTDTDSGTTSAVDIGSFLQLLFDHCVPEVGSTLRTLMEATMDAYDDMFVVRGVGPGTKPGTGMHITFPTRRDYLALSEFYYEQLFDKSLPWATVDAPEWLSFLETYYQSITPPHGVSSVCTLGASSSTLPNNNDDDGLLINPGISVQNAGYLIQSQVDRQVDNVLIEYGIDLTPLLKNRRRLSGLQESRQARKERPEVTKKVVKNRKRRSHGYGEQKERRTSQKLRQNEDYFIEFGGDLLVSFDGSTISAFWDKKFYSIETKDGEFESIYVEDLGNGTKSVPVIYLPPESPLTSADVSYAIGSTEEEFTDLYGGEYGKLSFSTVNAENGIISDAVSLFTYDGFTYSATPRLAGGQIVPIIYVEGRVEGEDLEVLVGGYLSTIIDWNEGTDIVIHAESAESYRDSLGVKYLLIDVLAIDDDALLKGEGDGVEFDSFEIDRRGTISSFGNKNANPSASDGNYAGPVVTSIPWKLVCGITMLVAVVVTKI